MRGLLYALGVTLDLVFNRVRITPEPLNEYDAFWRDLDDIETRARKQRNNLTERYGTFKPLDI